MTDELRDRALIVESLGSALRNGDHGLKTVPALLKRILAEESWRDFETRRGEHVTHDRFIDFVTTRPLRGLGASMDLITRIVGTDDPELLRMLRDALKSRRGRRTDLEPGVDFTLSAKGEDVALTAERLAREAPEEYEAVLRGERTIHAAAVRAGIRHHRIAIRLDNAQSAAETLRKHMSPEQLHALIKLLGEDTLLRPGIPRTAPSRVFSARNAEPC
jgi:hypothetical protein